MNARLNLFPSKGTMRNGVGPYRLRDVWGYHLRVDHYGYLQKTYDRESHDQPKHIASSINLVRHSHRDHIGVVGTILGLCQASACLMDLSGAQSSWATQFAKTFRSSVQHSFGIAKQPLFLNPRP